MATADHNDGRIFVFGSNLRGRHGLGAAKFALDHRGAVEGQGKGRQGQSYAIATKTWAIKTLPLEWIEKYTKIFIVYAREHPELRFEVTPIGTGLAGYKPEEIAPFFGEAPENCDLPDGWRK